MLAGIFANGYPARPDAATTQGETKPALLPVSATSGPG